MKNTQTVNTYKILNFLDQILISVYLVCIKSSDMDSTYRNN